MLRPVHRLRLTLILGTAFWSPIELVAQTATPVEAPTIPPLHGPGWEHTEVAVGATLNGADLGPGDTVLDAAGDLVLPAGGEAIRISIVQRPAAPIAK